jgi:hypothetical protein
MDPDTDPLPDVEAYLIAAGGAWGTLPASLRISVRDPRPVEDEILTRHLTGELKETVRAQIQAERGRSYERAIRAFAKSAIDAMRPR